MHLVFTIKFSVTGSYSSNNEVGLGGNLLTRFEEEIFKSMLQDMAVQSNRGLYVDRSKNYSRYT